MQIDCGLYRNLLSEFSAVSSYKIFKSSGFVSPQFHLFQGCILCEHIILYPVIRNIRSLVQNHHFVIYKTSKGLINLRLQIKAAIYMYSFPGGFYHSAYAGYVWIFIFRCHMIVI